MKYEINQQTKEIIDTFNITDDEKNFIFRHIEDAYYRGHTDGYLEGYSNGSDNGYHDGYEERYESGFSEGFDEAER